ncbi:MAG: hypothetical protein RL120_18935 [Gammaproteobacteria bacterium]
MSEIRFNRIAIGIPFATLLFSAFVLAQDSAPLEQFAGRWVINEQLSDNTDDQVAEAIEEGGGRDQRGLFNRQEDFYRGGPEEHELYDRISYDDVLSITIQPPEIIMEYEQGFRRVVYTDGRRRTTAASDFYNEGGRDFSSGIFQNNALNIEARVRDGGFTLETYTLEQNGNRLRVEMSIQPFSFTAEISLVRVYDRAN